MSDPRFYRNPFVADDADRRRAGDEPPTVERDNLLCGLGTDGRLRYVPTHAPDCPWRYGTLVGAGDLRFGTCNCCPPVANIAGVELHVEPYLPPGVALACDRKGNVLGVFRTGE